MAKSDGKTFGYMLYHHKPPADWPCPISEPEIYTQAKMDQAMAYIREALEKECDWWVVEEVFDVAYKEWLEKNKSRPPIRFLRNVGLTQGKSLIAKRRQEMDKNMNRFIVVLYEPNLGAWMLCEKSNDIDWIKKQYDKEVKERSDHVVKLIDEGWSGMYKTVVKEHIPEGCEDVVY